jgi:hypothetical protein
MKRTDPLGVVISIGDEELGLNLKGVSWKLDNLEQEVSKGDFLSTPNQPSSSP